MKFFRPFYLSLISFFIIGEVHAFKSFEKKNRSRFECRVESFHSISNRQLIDHRNLVAKKITVLESKAHFSDWLAIGDVKNPLWKTPAFSMGNRGTISETDNVYLFTTSHALIFVDLISKTGRYHYENDDVVLSVGFNNCLKLPYKY